VTEPVYRIATTGDTRGWRLWWRLVIRPVLLGVGVGVGLTTGIQHLAEDQQPWALMLFVSLMFVFLIYMSFRTGRDMNKHQRSLEAGLARLEDELERQHRQQKESDD
jgi:hypothetical protein